MITEDYMSDASGSNMTDEEIVDVSLVLWTHFLSRIEN